MGNWLCKILRDGLNLRWFIVLVAGLSLVACGDRPAGSTSQLKTLTAHTDQEVTHIWIDRMDTTGLELCLYGSNGAVREQAYPLHEQSINLFSFWDFFDPPVQNEEPCQGKRGLGSILCKTAEASGYGRWERARQRLIYLNRKEMILVSLRWEEIAQSKVLDIEKGAFEALLASADHFNRHPRPREETSISCE